MRKPRPSDCTDENDEFDPECYGSAMGDYEDFCRDQELEERMEREDEKERMADHSDQDPKDAV